MYIFLEHWLNEIMDKVCYSCKQSFKPGSLKTSRSRFKLIGITPPEGMSISDKICNSCLNKMYDTQIKQKNANNLKNKISQSSQTKKVQTSPSLPKKIGLEKKGKVFQ